jgi:hypothetical protein
MEANIKNRLFAVDKEREDNLSDEPKNGKLNIRISTFEF